MTITTGLIRDRDSVPATGGRSFGRSNPVTGETVTEAAAATPADAVAAVEAARRALPGWAGTAPSQRRDILLAAAGLLEAGGGDFARLMTGETGAAAPWVGFNLHVAAGMLREAAGLCTQVKGEIIPADKPGSTAFAFRRPAGVVLSIVPWNAPVILAVRGFATALACGNTVVLKGSELSPGTQHLLVRTMQAAGLPPGVLTYVTHAPEDAAEVVGAMIAHPAVRRVNFTGSTRTGRLIAELAARHLKPALLELGGKAPLLVLDDADLPNAARAAIFGAYIHQGQVCMSTERIIADRRVADDLAGLMAERVGRLAAADPGHSDAPLGALISAGAAERVDRLIDDALAKGAQALVRGRTRGAVMQPALLDHVTPEMDIYHEESFGPVACLIRAEDTEDAVRIANDTEYGLSSGIFGADVTRALAVAARLDFGCCHINGPTVHDEPQMPLGGMKASGYGRFGGQPGIDAFTEIQWVTIEDPAQPYPF